MAAVDTDHREPSTIALPGFGHASVLAGKSGPGAAESICRKAVSGRTRFIAEFAGSAPRVGIRRRDGSAMEINEQVESESARPGGQARLHKVQPGLTSLEEALAASNA